MHNYTVNFTLTVRETPGQLLQYTWHCAGPQLRCRPAATCDKERGSRVLVTEGTRREATAGLLQLHNEWGHNRYCCPQ